MTLTKLTIEYCGGIGCRSFALDLPVTVFAGEGREDVFAALCALTGSRRAGQQTCLARAGRLFAEAVCDGERYTIEARCAEGAPAGCIAGVRRGSRELSPEEGAALFSSSAEEESCSYFMAEEGGIDRGQPFSQTFARYLKAAAEEGAAFGERMDGAAFGERTDGAGVTQTFRRLLRAQIKGFAPRPVCIQKQLYLTLDERGNFTAKDAQPRKDLSATERTLLEYMSFIEVNRFWGEVRRAMGRTGERPLFVLSLADSIDESIDLAPLFAEAASLGRQVFAFSRDENISARIRSAENIKIYSL